MSYESDRLNADLYIDAQKEILAEAFSHPKDQMIIASVKEDNEENTDLRMVGLPLERVGLRVRDASAYQKHGREFTIRCWRASGAVTEWAKMLGGYGDFMLYGFAGKEIGKIDHWRIISLDKLRLKMKGFNMKTLNRKKNPDGRSDFYCFNRARFKECIVASSHEDDGVGRIVLTQTRN